jgi:large subunit GTPase 1
MLTGQSLGRRLWADYFDEQGVQYAFFSAMNAAALQRARREAMAGQEEDEPTSEKSSSREKPGEEWKLENENPESVHDEPLSELGKSSSEEDSENDMYFSAEEDNQDSQDDRAKVLSVLELEHLFKRVAPDISGACLFQVVTR